MRYAMGLPDMCFFASNNLIQFPIVDKIIRYMRLLSCTLLFIKRIIWFHFFLLPDAHGGLSYISLKAVQSFGAVAPIAMAEEAIKVLGCHA